MNRRLKKVAGLTLLGSSLLLSALFIKNRILAGNFPDDFVKLVSTEMSLMQLKQICSGFALSLIHVILIFLTFKFGLNAIRQEEEPEKKTGDN